MPGKNIEILGKLPLKYHRRPISNLKNFKLKLFD
jgi:hypothetical protein